MHHTRPAPRPPIDDAIRRRIIDTRWQRALSVLDAWHHDARHFDLPLPEVLSVIREAVGREIADRISTMADTGAMELPGSPQWPAWHAMALARIRAGRTDTIGSTH